MKKPLVLGVAGLVLFSGTVLGLLAGQGRLNHAGTRGIPLLSSFFPPPPEPDPVHAGEGAGKKDAHGTEHKPAGEPTGDKGHGAASEAGRSDGLGKENPLPYRQGTSVLTEQPKGGGGHGAPADASHGDPGGHKPDPHAADQGHSAAPQVPEKQEPDAHEPPDSTSDWRAKVDSVLGQGQFRPGRLWSFPQMEAGVSVDELNEILRRAREERTAIERDRGAIVQQRRELEARERDVVDRQDAVLAKLREVEQLRATLQAEIDEFHNTVLLIRQDELSGLQSVAKTLAGVEAKSAAAVIKKWWETDEGQTRALKIWSVMDPDAANAILAELDVEMIRQVLEKRLKVTREQAKAKK